MSEYQAADRRPIAARDLGPSQRAASWLVARHVSANAISVGGMLAGVLAGIALAATTATEGGPRRILWVAAALLMQARLVANMLDGMVAIKSGTASPVGELYNEVPDRVSDSAILVGAGYGATGDPLLGYVAAGLALFTAYVRTAGKAAGAPHDYRGPMAKQHRMALLTVACLVLAAMPAAWAASTQRLMSVALAVIAAGCLITSWRRLAFVAAHLRAR